MNSIEMKSRMLLPGAGEGENGELLFNGYGVSVWEGEKVLETDGDIMDTHQCQCT